MGYNSMIISIYEILCNHFHYLIPPHFYHPQKKIPTISSQSQFPLSPVFGKPVVCFLSLWICLFLILPVNEILKYVAFCV